MAEFKGYETIFITPAELNDADAGTIKESLLKLVKKHKGKEVVFADWGKRRLTYPIEKHSRGNYWYFCYLSDSNVPNEVDRSLRLNERVLRHLTIKIADSEDAPIIAKIAKEGGVFTTAADESHSGMRY